MKKVIIFLVILHLSALAYNQVIKGTVFDKKTNETIPAASAYFSGTYTGALADASGNFALDVSKNSPMPLTVSALGYYSETLTNAEYLTGKPVKVYLTPKVFELKEVVINARARDRERYQNMKLFKKEFLGTTENALMCEIVNDEDITFSTDPSHDTLKVFASKPIIINNNGLGYQITYFLDKFEFCKKDQTFLYKGSVYFNTDMSYDKSKKQFFERRRKYAYQGSRLQFFRSLYLNDLKSTGFIVTNAVNRNLDYSDFVVTSGRSKSLRYKEKLGICYYSDTPSSWIVFLKDRVSFDNSGYFDSSGIIWEGQMTKQRIGDLLPFEYAVK